MTEIKKCPFCGMPPHFPSTNEVFGTWYEVECCQIAGMSIQISDILMNEERHSSDSYDSTNNRYRPDLIERVRAHAIDLWNKRKGK